MVFNGRHKARIIYANVLFMPDKKGFGRNNTITMVLMADIIQWF